MLERLARFILSFRGLRGRLVLTYTLVTVLALLALEVLAGAGLFVLAFWRTSDTYIYIIQNDLRVSAADYLKPGSEDLEGLQNWVTYVRQSETPRPSSFIPFYTPPSRYAAGEALLVLDPEGKILACAPECAGRIGRVFTTADEAFKNGPLALATNRTYAEKNPVDFNAYYVAENGLYRMAFPVTVAVPPAEQPVGGADRMEDKLVGVVVVTITPPPPLGDLIPAAILGLVILTVTGVMLLCAVIPFGLLFGFIMSRGLTRRLSNLTAAADAWSEGNFEVKPRDHGKDEIGVLSNRMRNMAERVQNLLETQQELALMEERNRLARDLHDTVKQQTFATLMQLRAAKNTLDSDPAAARASLQEAETLVKATQQDLGLIIAELRPAALEGQGLAEALKKYLATWNQHTRILYSYHVSGQRSLPLAAEQALYRIAQEALSNVARHSSASQVDLTLAYDAEKVVLSVQDNGRGFDPALQSDRAFGLQSMKQRAEALQGDFTIQSGNEGGVWLTVSIPIQKGEIA
ncbi:MAG TPA: sensor histidine kinase [Anaerolineaceae bacterium]|mgnify:FL=1|nr:sensor histidine kinase [Anaerolineaceae bacterium]HPN52036.1 sensor histidine kinase [Anaerolineaceae bacterium]